MDENLPDLTEEFKQFFIQELLWLMGKWLFLKDKVCYRTKSTIRN